MFGCLSMPRLVFSCHILAFIVASAACISAQALCGTGDALLPITIPIDAFAEAYQKTFAMSDGSFVDTSRNQHMCEAFKKMLTLMQNIGVHPANATMGLETYQLETYQLNVCQEQLAEIFMLAVLGNFVVTPDEAQKTAELSYTKSIATVVVNRMGDLTIVNSFDAMRTFYLESLLFVSIVAVARLSVAAHR